jgi:hypothetical protein
MMPRFNVMAYEIAQLTIVIRGGKENSATGETFQNSINRWQANALKLLLQPGLHLKGIEQAPAF